MTAQVETQRFCRTGGTPPLLALLSGLSLDGAFGLRVAGKSL